MSNLPEDFNAFEHLQTVFRATHNRLVREEFKDYEGDGDIVTPRGSLKLACLVTDNDNDAMMNLRLWLFYVLVRKAADFQPPIYGVPTWDLHEKAAFAPQVKLYFSQDIGSVPEGKSPIRSTLTFRVKGETNLTITEGNLLTLATRIKAQFGQSGGYRWSRGEILVTYRDPDKVISLQIYALNKSEGEQVVRKILDCAGEPFNPENFVTHQTDASFANVGQTRNILGRVRQLPVKRPTAFVRFRWASIAIHGIPNDIALVAPEILRKNPILTFEL